MLAGLDHRILDQVLGPMTQATQAAQAIAEALRAVAPSRVAPETPRSVSSKLGETAPFDNETRPARDLTTTEEAESTSPGATRASNMDSLDEVSSQNPTPEELVDAFLRAHPEIPNHEALAEKIGIGRDVLFAIKGEKRWVRSAAYEFTALLIGCKEQDLHPRSVVRRRRKGKSNSQSN